LTSKKKARKERLFWWRENPVKQTTKKRQFRGRIQGKSKTPPAEQGTRITQLGKKKKNKEGSQGPNVYWISTGKLGAGEVNCRKRETKRDILWAMQNNTE